MTLPFNAIARELVEGVRSSATLDWTVKESVRTKMRVMVRRILRMHGDPPEHGLDLARRGKDARHARDEHAGVPAINMMPLLLAAAPPLIAWPLSDASFDSPAQRAQLGVGAVVQPGEGALIFARLRI